MKIHELIYTLDMVDSAARDIVDILPLVSIVTFSAPLGAGKTTLIQAILRQVSIDADIQSPTFTYVNTYANAQGQTFYHFDLYRIASLQHFRQAGFDEYLYQPNSWALIEWPEVIMPLLHKRSCHIVIEYYGNDRRRLLYSLHS